jgi:hypothetical protein
MDSQNAVQRVAELEPQNWTSIDEAYQRLLVLVGGPLELAACDLYQALCDGRLRSSARILTRDRKTEAAVILSAEFWKTEVARIEPYWLHPKTRAHVLPRRGFAEVWYFLIHRNDLERLTIGVEQSPPPEGKRGSRVQTWIREVADTLYPGGYQDIASVVLINEISKALRKKGYSVPERSTFLRALGRRRD